MTDSILNSTEPKPSKLTFNSQFANQDEGASLWLNAAYNVLITQGVAQIRISALADQLETTRTAFYWYFSSRQELLDRLVALWQAKNTDNLIARINAYAHTINEAVFNMFDCWLDQNLFDVPLDLAIRHWASADPALSKKVTAADQTRIAALYALFLRFKYDENDAFTRAHTVYYTQIGYISMMVQDERKQRLGRMPDYAAVYTGVKPSAQEIERFFSRHL